MVPHEYDPPQVKLTYEYGIPQCRSPFPLGDHLARQWLLGIENELKIPMDALNIRTVNMIAHTALLVGITALGLLVTVTLFAQESSVIIPTSSTTITVDSAGGYENITRIHNAESTSTDPSIFDYVNSPTN